MERSMRHVLLFSMVSMLGVAVVLAACHGSIAEPSDDADAGASGSGATLEPPAPTPVAPTNTQTGAAGTGLATGLPCDVQGVLENRCIGCHGQATSEAPPLLSYEDFTKPSTADATKTRV